MHEKAQRGLSYSRTEGASWHQGDTPLRDVKDKALQPARARHGNSPLARHMRRIWWGRGKAAGVERSTSQGCVPFNTLCCNKRPTTPFSQRTTGSFELARNPRHVARYARKATDGVAGVAHARVQV